MKDNIIDADVIWTSNGSGDSISDGIRLDEYDGNSEGFTVGISLVKHWALLTTQLLVLLILPNLENNLDLEWMNQTTKKNEELHNPVPEDKALNLSYPFRL